MRTVHVVVPDSIDDPARPSGGNRYDRRICDGLASTGWAVCLHEVAGGWPRPDPAALARLARTTAALPDDGLLVVDGLIGCAAAPVLVPEAGRLRLVVLVHMPFGGAGVAAEDEAAVLTRARAVVATSSWTRERLLDRHPLSPARVHVARPGADRADPAPGTDGGGRLLCVGAVVPHKGQDLLLAALAEIAEPPWRCTVVGPLDRDPVFTDRLRRRAADAEAAGRIFFTGPLAGGDLAQEYHRADLLVVPSRSEAYGMAATEALAAALPVVATAVGGLPEALGRTPLGPPGLLVPPEDPSALAAALAGWLRSAELRGQLRRAALARREDLAPWDATTMRVAAVLSGVGDEPVTVRGPVRP